MHQAIVFFSLLAIVLTVERGSVISKRAQMGAISNFLYEWALDDIWLKFHSVVKLVIAHTFENAL